MTTPPNRGPYLIYGGTGSLGRALCDRLLAHGCTVAVFSRDEAKHHRMRQEYPQVTTLIGDVRDYGAVAEALGRVRPAYVINAAAMKQMPLCEEFPREAVATNVTGAQHVADAVRALATAGAPIRAVFISTDKACEPINAYGMTKALAERIHLRANDAPRAVFTCVRYGNVLESTGSVIPVFKERLARGLPLRITHADMTRFLLSLPQAVDLVLEALADPAGGNIYVPKLPAAKIADVAEALAIAAKVSAVAEISGIRPGDKLHELLISKEEISRTEEQGERYIIRDINGTNYPGTGRELLSKDHVMTPTELADFLRTHGVIS